jgi:DNA-binding transcriptional LysR family regulator
MRSDAIQLSNVDMNLFLVLHTVLAEESVTRAAEKLHVTQSAVSNALARLRELLRDPLVVRHGRGLVPTPRARELAPVLADAMVRLQSTVDGADFLPEQSSRLFTLGWSDAQTIAHLPALLPLFAERLPRATLRIVTVDYIVATDGLARGDVDAGIGPTEAAEPPLLAEPLYADGVSFLARKGHAVVGPRLTRDDFDRVEFVDVQLALGRGGVGNRTMTQLLGEHGLKWKVGLVVPEFTAAAYAVAVSDYLVGMPTRTARALCGSLPLQLVELPAFLGRPTMEMVLMWHPRTDGDAGARYFRTVVAQACRGDPSSRRRAARRRAPR